MDGFGFGEDLNPGEVRRHNRESRDGDCFQMFHNQEKSVDRSTVVKARTSEYSTKVTPTALCQRRNEEGLAAGVLRFDFEHFQVQEKSNNTIAGVLGR